MKRALILAAAIVAASPAAAEDAHDRALAAGYKAAFLCSGLFNAGQTPEQVARAIFGAYAPLQVIYGAAATGPMWVLAEMRADNTTYEQNQTDRSLVLNETVDDFMTTQDNTAVASMSCTSNVTWWSPGPLSRRKRCK